MKWVLLLILVYLIPLATASTTFEIVEVNNIKTTSVEINWEINSTESLELFTTSQVEYGLTSSYGTTSEIDDYSYYHQHTLSGLSENTTYHYRIKSIDYYENEYFTTDSSFTTLTQTAMNNLVKSARADNALPKTYYVRTDGNNSASGLLNVSYATNSTDCAFLTISKGMTVLDAGDTLRVQSGLYNESASGLAKSGIPTHYINIITDGDVILDSQYVNTNGIWIDARQYYYWKIDGFTIQNYTTTGIYAFNSASNTKNWEVSNCTISNVPTAIWSNSHVKNVMIHHNTIDNVARGFRIGADGTNSKHLIIKNNNINDTSDYAIELGTSTYNIITDNELTNTQYGINVYSRISVRNNIFTDIGIRTVRVGTAWNTHVLICNNTFTNAGLPAILYPHTSTILLSNILTNSGKFYGTGPLYVWIENNTLTDSNIEFGPGAESGPDLPIGTFNMTNNMITRGNLGNIILNGVENGKISNNVFKETGIKFSVSDTGFYINNTTISNNVFYNSSTGIILGNAPSNNINIKNNIFSDHTGYVINNINSVDLSVSYNMFWNNSTTAVYNFSATNSLFANPLFADISTNDFHLKSEYGRWDGTTWITDALTSPAIDAGNPNDDFSNEPADWGANINLGKYGNTIYASKSSWSFYPACFYTNVQVTINRLGNILWNYGKPSANDTRLSENFTVVIS